MEPLRLQNEGILLDPLTNEQGNRARQGLHVLGGCGGAHFICEQLRGIGFHQGRSEVFEGSHLQTGRGALIGLAVAREKWELGERG